MSGKKSGSWVSGSKRLISLDHDPSSLGVIFDYAPFLTNFGHNVVTKSQKTTISLVLPFCRFSGKFDRGQYWIGLYNSNKKCVPFWVSAVHTQSKLDIQRSALRCHKRAYAGYLTEVKHPTQTVLGHILENMRKFSKTPSNNEKHYSTDCAKLNMFLLVHV